MNEDFVSFELAKKLKEKGFREKCLAYYDVEDNVGLLYNTQYTDEALPCQYTDLLRCHNTGEAETQPDDSGFCIDAPTISQVLNWLRKEKKILVVAAPAFLYKEARYFWQCGIYKISLLPNVIPFHKFIDNQESRESAILAGIEYAIDNFLI